MRVVYKVLPDGKYELVAAFNINQSPPFPSDWAQEIADWLVHEGQAAVVIEQKLKDLLIVKSG